MTPAVSAFLVATFAGIVAASGCATGGPPDIEVRDLAVSANTGEVSAAYGTVVNTGKGDDALVSVSCSCSDTVTLHHSERSDGRSKMVDAERIELPAGERVDFVPAGSHLMLEQLTAELTAGDIVELTFEFERSEARSFDVAVVEPAELVDRVDPTMNEGT